MRTNRQLSAQHLKILQFLWRYQQKYHRSPTYREIEKGIGASTPSVPNYHIRRLEEMGYLERPDHVSRGLRLTGKALRALRINSQPALLNPEIVQIQIRGHIVAGEPVDPGEDSPGEHDTVAIDGRMLPNRREDLFAVRVHGDSMIDALVQEGDIVLLQKVSEVKNGDMVAAWLQLEEETTLKHFYQEGKMARLQPANPAYEPIIVPASNVDIQGKVVMVFRGSLSA